MNFDFNNDYVLEDDRASLRPLTPSDIGHLHIYSQHEPEIWKYSLVSAAGEEGLKKYLRIAFTEKEKKTQYPFIVFDKQFNKYAGCTRYYSINSDFQSLEIGYTWYGQKFQGTGLNKHCKYLLLQFAFESAGVERVTFRADSKNARSIAAMKSIGCTIEGILRKDVPVPAGGRRDSIILSILRDEWFSHVKEDLTRKL